jgi:hypothetical protein
MLGVVAQSRRAFSLHMSLYFLIASQLALDHCDDYFTELCALSTTDVLSPAEWKQLELHLSFCAQMQGDQNSVRRCHCYNASGAGCRPYTGRRRLRF